MELYKHKVSVLERHCESVGRDPSDIKKTLLMPIKITDNKSEAKEFIEKLGYRSSDTTHGSFGGKLVTPLETGSVAGSVDYVVERIGEFIDEGVEEIMFGAIETGDSETLQMIDEEVLRHFV